MNMSGRSTEGTDWLMQGTQAVARKGYGFLLEDVCNHCTLRKIFMVYGFRKVVPCPDKEGVEVLVRGVPFMWFDEVTERCICNL